MNRTEILEKLNEVFHDVFDNNDIVVTEQTNANDIEEWDSLIHITLIRRSKMSLTFPST